jgi:hypothetical protein
MKPSIKSKTTVPPCFIFLALVAFALSPLAQAVNPPPDGNYPNFNTAEGENALFSLTSGAYNTALGAYTLLSTNANANTAVGAFALSSNSTGVNNTANGAATLSKNSTGNSNTAVGLFALYSNVGGSNNVAVGNSALQNNDTDGNTAVGYSALFANTAGHDNTAVGLNALANNNSTYNTATGWQALFHNTNGYSNSAFGRSALEANIVGHENTAMGQNALLLNQFGNNNTAIGQATLQGNFASDNTALGWHALIGNSGGPANTAVGKDALANNAGGTGSVAVGWQALSNSSGDNNIGIGVNAGSGVTTRSNIICIGANVAGTNNWPDTCYIGNIYGGLATMRAVYIDSDNSLGTLQSTRRVKDDIKPMDKASEAVLSLKPVTFRYKKKIDRTHTRQFGLVAEDVAEVSADLVTLDRDGKPETVRYEAVNAMLLNEFLKEHRKVEKLEAAVVQQQKQIKALTAGLQKVSARVDMSKPAPQTVATNP